MSKRIGTPKYLDSQSYFYIRDKMYLHSEWRAVKKNYAASVLDYLFYFFTTWNHIKCSWNPLYLFASRERLLRNQIFEEMIYDDEREERRRVQKVIDDLDK